MTQRRNHRATPRLESSRKKVGRGASGTVRAKRKSSAKPRQGFWSKFFLARLSFLKHFFVNQGLKLLTTVLMLGFFSTAGYFSYAALNRAADRPVQTVSIEGSFTFVSQDEVSALLDPIVVDGFVQLPLMAVKKQLEQHPWIAEVNVSRRWPDTLLVSIVEQQAIARWGETGFLNQLGNIVEVEQTPFLASLPWLEGNDKEATMLMQTYQQFVQLLRPHGLKITALHTDNVDEMTVSLSNGLVLYLGKDQVMDKFQRFLLVLQQALRNRLEQVVSVDLRYGNGLAVQWRLPEATMENVVADRGL